MRVIKRETEVERVLNALRAENEQLKTIMSNAENAPMLMTDVEYKSLSPESQRRLNIILNGMAAREAETNTKNARYKAALEQYYNRFNWCIITDGDKFAWKWNGDEDVRLPAAEALGKVIE